MLRFNAKVGVPSSNVCDEWSFGQGGSSSSAMSSSAQVTDLLAVERCLGMGEFDAELTELSCADRPCAQRGGESDGGGMVRAGMPCSRSAGKSILTLEIRFTSPRACLGVFGVELELLPAPSPRSPRSPKRDGAEEIFRRAPEGPATSMPLTCKDLPPFRTLAKSLARSKEGAKIRAKPREAEGELTLWP